MKNIEYFDGNEMSGREKTAQWVNFEKKENFKIPMYRLWLIVL